MAIFKLFASWFLNVKWQILMTTFFSFNYLGVWTVSLYQSFYNYFCKDKLVQISKFSLFLF